MADEFSNRLLHGHKINLSIGRRDSKQIRVARAVSGSVNFTVVVDFLYDLNFVGFLIDEGFACGRLRFTFTLKWNLDFDFH
jgi:hypothetical protein